MKYSTFAVASLIASVGAAPAQAPQPLTKRDFAIGVDLLAVKGVFNLGMDVAFNGYPNRKCNLANVAVRKEWGNLLPSERRSYIAAVKCLARKTGITPAKLAAGVRNRYDDFVATHINQTFNIHGTGNFLAWHRYFTWTYEQALRNECGYQGYQPYWNWGKYASDPVNSPIFDGSDDSMGGNGANLAHNDTCIPSADQCQVRIKAENGGGCVTKGPFSDWKVNLGPVSPGIEGVPANSDWLGLNYNPRCLRRAVSKGAASWTTDDQTVDLIVNNPDPYWFMTNMQGNFPAGYLGVHTGGHFTVGGDPGGDLFASPGDPVFFLHHANIDRVWWIWQNLDIKNRQYAVSATITINNSPPSRNTTLDDLIDMGVNGGPITIRDASHTLGGPFCYIYA